MKTPTLLALATVVAFSPALTSCKKAKRPRPPPETEPAEPPPSAPPLGTTPPVAFAPPTSPLPIDSSQAEPPSLSAKLATPIPKTTSLSMDLGVYRAMYKSPFKAKFAGKGFAVVAEGRLALYAFAADAVPEPTCDLAKFVMNAKRGGYGMVVAEEFKGGPGNYRAAVGSFLPYDGKKAHGVMAAPLEARVEVHVFDGSKLAAVVIPRGGSDANVASGTVVGPVCPASLPIPSVPIPPPSTDLP